jgi:hypothetical protein
MMSKGNFRKIKSKKKENNRMNLKNSKLATSISMNIRRDLQMYNPIIQIIIYRKDAHMKKPSS